jgi:hypothetical protein
MMKVFACLVLSLTTATVAVAADSAQCTFDGKFHGPGAIVCNNGKQQRCRKGVWESLGTSCSHHAGHPGVHSPKVKSPATTPQPGEPHQPPAHQPPSPS